MDAVIDRAVEVLTAAGVTLDAGLSERELADVEGRFGFTFSVVHRALLGRVLPVDGADGEQRWPDWRSAGEEEIRRRLAWPVEGVLFDVANEVFWDDAWGARPEDDEKAQEVAREQLSILPPMIPLYGHRFLPSQPCADDPPVLSIYQTDVIYYGRDLVDYLVHEFGAEDEGVVDSPVVEAERRVPFWSDLVDG